MLKKIYIDNWRCFVNFECPLEAIQLLVGSNGVGKSSVFDALALIRSFVCEDEPLAKLLPYESLTRWSSPDRVIQTFELEVERSGQVFHYSLNVEHNPVLRKSRVHLESLELDGATLFHFEKGTVQLYRDDFTTGPTFKFERTRSGLGTVGAGNDNKNLEWFRAWLSSSQVVRLNPFGMRSEAHTEAMTLDKHGVNFSEWFRHSVQEDLEINTRLTNRLQEVWPDFRSLKLEKAGEDTRLLKAKFGSESYSFAELSDGQRCLIVLNAFLCFVEASGSNASKSEVSDSKASGFSLVAFDEALNFVALREIQWWLAEWVSLADDNRIQVLFSGHHPEVIDFLGTSRSLHLSRTAGGPTRVGPLEFQLQTTMPPSALISRGLVDE